MGGFAVLCFTPSFVKRFQVTPARSPKIAWLGFSGDSLEWLDLPQNSIRTTLSATLTCNSWHQSIFFWEVRNPYSYMLFVDKRLPSLKNERPSLLHFSFKDANLQLSMGELWWNSRTHGLLIAWRNKPARLFTLVDARKLNKKSVTAHPVNLCFDISGQQPQTSSWSVF